MYWIIACLAISLAGFFGVLYFLNHRAPKIDTASTPCIIQMSRQEHDSLTRYGIIYPDRGFFAKNGMFILPLSLDELREFYADVMAAAQDAIGRAARRKQVTLGGATLHVGTLAGYLHRELLRHWQNSGEPDPPPLVFPLAVPDNAPDGHA